MKLFSLLILSILSCALEPRAAPQLKTAALNAEEKFLSDEIADEYVISKLRKKANVGDKFHRDSNKPPPLSKELLFKFGIGKRENVDDTEEALRDIDNLDDSTAHLRMKWSCNVQMSGIICCINKRKYQRSIDSMRKINEVMQSYQIVMPNEGASN